MTKKGESASVGGLLLMAVMFLSMALFGTFLALTVHPAFFVPAIPSFVLSVLLNVTATLKSMGAKND